MNSNTRTPDASAASDWLQEVRQLVEIVCNSGIAELEVRNGGTRLRLRTGEPGSYPNAPASAPGTAEEVEEDGFAQVVTAPLTGVFYWAASPTASPFVCEGELVEAGQVIGLVEAMKVFNEVRAEHDGRIRRFLVENGTVVTSGTPLILLDECSVALDVEALN